MAAATKVNDVENVTARQKIYGFLASMFLLAPAQASMRENQVILQKMFESQGLQTDWEDQPTDSDAIEQQYYDCFFVPTSGFYVPPYESALLGYNPSDGRHFGKLNGNSVQHVASCWAATGFNPEKLTMFEPLRQSYMPDHIGLELAFMAFLCGAEKKALLQGTGNESLMNATKWREYQAGFLREHLCKWTGNFAKALSSGTCGYYAQVAEAASVWVEVDSKELENMINLERNKQ